MIIPESILRHAQMLEEKQKETGDRLSRQTIKKTLKVSESQARDIRTLLDNPHLIKQAPKSILENVAMRGLLLADPHIPYHDESAVNIAIEYGKAKKCDLIIIIGDLLDFYQISRFTRDPKKRSVEKEIESGLQFLTTLRKEFPKARIIYKTGNHDERLEKYIFNQAPNISELLENLLQDKLELKKLNIDFEPNFFKIGKLWILHGHELPTRNTGGMVNICDFVFRAVYDHFVCGHFHQSHNKTFKRIDRNLYSTYSVGWLGSDTAAEYSPLNKYAQGFAFCEWNNKGDFQLENFKIYEGKVYS